MTFVWNNSTISIPKITDIIENNSTGVPDVARIFTYAWIWAFGGWFFAMIIGALAAALYIKYNNALVPAVFLLLMVILFGAVLSTPAVGFPSAEAFVYIVVVIAAFTIGFTLYRLFIGK